MPSHRDSIRDRKLFLNSVARERELHDEFIDRIGLIPASGVVLARKLGFELEAVSRHTSRRH